MRGDSVYKADLTALCEYNFQLPREPNPYHIMVLRDEEGKQSKEKAHFSKVMMH